MDKYLEIYYNKIAKTQFFVIINNNQCEAVIQKKLIELKIPFTHNKFLGKLEKNIDEYKKNTFAYAKKFTWLDTVEL